MEQNNEIQTQSTNQIQGVFAQPRVSLSRDGEYLLHFLPGNMIVRKHVNFYKKILLGDGSFTPKAKAKATA